ncbi:HEAT repeat-containing protein 5B isoform X2 [Anthonomus grandis grandis]|uniref:HEAT repeat-containing protein 5B isoform X2 n=1 Tax=Anthonomus grandis grandis TaxID=2921223 RepID=UPI0021658714|nr:HEAT repeat-containing protein 5B isoform X2 [Anthonomus grandis grandis]
MELSHSLTLNEEALAQISEANKPVFIFEWLRYLDKVLVAAQKNDIKGCQKQLVQQLMNHINNSPGPSTRQLIARCLATLFSVGDAFLLFDTVNQCNDILKNKDDSPSFLPTRLAAICCVGTMYEKLGRMMGRSYEETVQILVRSLRSAESQTRIEIMLTLEKVCAGMGSAAINIHKDIYKAARPCLVDRNMAVRCAASKCLLELLKHATFLHTTELESLATLCFRAFDGSNYEVRCAVARLLGTLVATTQQNQKEGSSKNALVNKNVKVFSLDEAMGILMSGFLRGGVGFLKGTGEIIKGSSGVNREVRVGVTHAYVTFVQILGSSWLEKNMKTFLSHVLYLVANPKAASSHVDAVYSRKCINFILRCIFGRMFGEKAQITACKQIAQIIVKEMNSIDFNPENAKEFNQETLFSQHLLVCALQEIGSLILSLGTTAHVLITDQSLNVIDVTMGVLVHPCQAARLAAAWCLRCICVAVPSQISPLIDRCVSGLEQYRTSPEAISGYSSALVAVLGGVKLSPLGVPHTKGKIIFNTAEELLRSASQNSRLSIARTNAGWLLVGAVAALGPAAARPLLPRMLLLWRNAFPRSAKELESEKARGDVFTWQVALEGRAGALAAMHSLLLHCPALATGEDAGKRLLQPVEAALAMLTSLSGVLKTYGQQLKAPAAMVRLRLCETLLLLPPHSFESSYTHLLRMLVAEFTLAENPANTTTSQLKTVCHADDAILLGTWLQETDHGTIEDQLQTHSAAGSGALEHDPSCLFRAGGLEDPPGPLPLGVAVIDAAVLLFGQLFPRVSHKHRMQTLDHFAECVRASRSSRQEAVQLNAFAALLCGLRSLSAAKASLSAEEAKRAGALATGALAAPGAPAVLRAAAAETLGRLARALADPRFTAELIQASIERLKTARDAASRTGHSLALGALHRHVGGLGAARLMQTSVSILLALAQDRASAAVQAWALHALRLCADAGGPMFRGFVEPALAAAIRLLLETPPASVDVYRCVGKLLSSLITTIGPELQGNTSTICMARSSFLCACAALQGHPEPVVQAEATACLQQLHLFAPKHVNLSSLVPTLCRALSSDHLLLRKAAISCLRQLAQREAKEVCELAAALASEGTNVEGLIITETGLPGVFFGLLDTETDSSLIKDIHDTIISMLQVLATGQLTEWLGLCKDVLTVASEPGEDQRNGLDVPEDDDQEQFHAEEENQRSVQPRWPTRVFAAECARRVLSACTAKRLGSQLPDLIRMAFVAATSDSDPLRLEGLKMLREIIEKFATEPEPEFPEHLLLEQFQAQVSAALRPAFAGDTAPHVTAAACEVCSAWIGARVARDAADLRRVHQLIVSSLGKLGKPSAAGTLLYNEAMLTLERLAILKAWAEVYAVAAGARGPPDSGLLELVKPQLATLARHWLNALRDRALLALPPEFSGQLPHDGGAFYTAETAEAARQHYTASWPPILLAAALWLSQPSNTTISPDDEPNNNPAPDDHFRLLFGTCIEALCGPRGTESPEIVDTCLRALRGILEVSKARELLLEDPALIVELCNVLHRLVLTLDSADCSLLCMEVLQQVLRAATNKLDDDRNRQPDNVETRTRDDRDAMGEGGKDGDLDPDKSLVFAALEICLCLIVRQIPALSPTPHPAMTGAPRVADPKLLGAAFNALSALPGLCSLQGTLSVLPTLLYLGTGVLKEAPSAAPGALQLLRVLASDERANDEEWRHLLQSALAKVIDLAKTPGPDEAAPLLAIAVFVLHAPSEVAAAPNLQYPCINHFRQCLQSNDNPTKLKCIKTLKSLFSHTEKAVATPYIHSLAPQLVEFLYSDNAKRITSNEEFCITVETINAVESLIALAEPHNRIQMLSLLVPTLVNYLLQNPYDKSLNKYSVSLHEVSLEKLMKIGPTYPQEFKKLMSTSTQLRTKLESAIRSSQQNSIKVKNENNINQPMSIHMPTIKLKTDFSNFS